MSDQPDQNFTVNVNDAAETVIIDETPAPAPAKTPRRTSDADQA